MRVRCRSCEAELQLNANLAGMTVSCPQCGAPVKVPEAKKRSAAPAPAPRAKPKPKARPRTAAATRSAAQKSDEPLRRQVNHTTWSFLTQLVLGALGVSCIAGALFYPGWKPPASSYFALAPVILFPAGGALLFAGWLAGKWPVVSSLLAAIAVLGACAQNYWTASAVDVSRVLALSVSLLAVWLALQHRRVCS